MPRKYSGPLQAGKRTAMVPRRPRRPPARKQSIVKLIKTVALSQCESKRKSEYSEGLNLIHNQTHYVTRIMATTQGITNPSGADNIIPAARIGNEIIAKGFSLKLYLESINSYGSTHYKVIVFKYPTRVMQSVGVNDALLWQGANGVGGNNILRIIDTIATNRVKVLKQTILRPHQFYTKYHEIYINLKNKKIRYVEDKATDPQFEDLGFAVVACNEFGTPANTHIANLHYNLRFTFKDP